MKTPTFASDLRDMMTAWDKMRDAVRREFPGATEAKIDAITRQMFEHSLGIKAAS